MNNTNSKSELTNDRDSMVQVMNLARQKSAEYARKVFFTQTGPDSFNFHFDVRNPECGPVVAVFENGRAIAAWSEVIPNI